MPAIAARVSRAEASQRLRDVPLPVLQAMNAELQKELQKERSGLQSDQKEWEDVAKRLACVEAQLTAALQRIEAKERREKAEAESVARAERLLRAGTRKSRALETAIAKIEGEIAGLNAGEVFIVAGKCNMDASVSPHCRREQDHEEAHNTASFTPAAKVSRAAAASQRANDEQRHAAAQHAKKQQVLQLERENNIMQQHLEVLRRGDATSTRLYHILAGAKAV